MKEREQNDLLSLGNMVRGGYSGIIANAGKVIAVEIDKNLIPILNL